MPSDFWIDIWTGMLAVATIALAVITGVLARYTYKLWKDASETSIRQASETKEAISLARKEFMANHRPWVTAEFTLASGITKGKSGIDFSLQLTLKNTGNSPALNVKPGAYAFILIGNGDPYKKHSEIIDMARNDRPIGNNLCYTLFPGDNFNILINKTIGDKDIKKYYDLLDNMPHESSHREELPPFIILGCISYTSVFSPEIHITGFSLDIRYIDKVQGEIRQRIPALNNTRPQVPIEDLILTHSRISGATAD